MFDEARERERGRITEGVNASTKNGVENEEKSKVTRRWGKYKTVLKMRKNHRLRGDEEGNE